jgi:RNA polymerase sigma factor (sigma-70 family)
MKNNFQAIYRHHYPQLYTLAFRMTGNNEDSEDILQNSFLNAFKAFEKFRFESSVYTWLYKIVMNEAKKHYRERRKLPVEEYSEQHNLSQKEVYEHINSFGTSENNTLVELTRENCLQMFMNCMPSKYRTVYTLRVILQFSIKETAEILDITESTIKVNLNRARNVIQSHFKGRCSLLTPGAMCHCRGYAQFLKAKNMQTALIDINVVRRKEGVARKSFGKELKTILQIQELYNITVQPMAFDDFMERVKSLCDEKSLKLLAY